MKYRVNVKIGYYEAWFDFEDMADAGEFAKTVLTHQVPNEDTRRKTSVSIRVMSDGEETEDEE